MSLRERRLLRRLQQREESAFRELLATHGDRIFSLCYRFLGQREEAEDLAQEVFISVFKSIDSFRGDSSLATWLYRITTNHCKNRLRFLARHAELRNVPLSENAERAAEPGTAAPPPVSPDQSLSAKESEDQLGRAIATLDEEHRILVILRDIEDLSYEQIAEITGVPEGTIKSRLHRARATLRERLEKSK